MAYTLELRDKRTGEVTFEGRRVGRGLECFVCRGLHRQQSWCLVDGVRGIAICPRVESDRPIRARKGAAIVGYLHYADGARRPRQPLIVRRRPQPEDSTDWSAFYDALNRSTELAAVVSACERLAEEWSIDRNPGPDDVVYRPGAIDPSAVYRLGCVPESQGYVFPMRNADGRVVGLRRRLYSGAKIAYTGSRVGLIRPLETTRSGDLVIVEGESDAAAALSLGLDAIARPGCLLCETESAAMAKGRNVVIVRDNDGPGVRGAKSLREALRPYARSVTMVHPPARWKDLRKWVINGATAETFRRLVRNVRGG